MAAASCTAHARQIRTVKVSRDSTQQHMTQGYSLQSVEWFHKCTGPASWATLTFLILNQGCLLSLPLLPRQNSSQQSQRFPSSWSSTHTHTHSPPRYGNTHRHTPQATEATPHGASCHALLPASHDLATTNTVGGRASGYNVHATPRMPATRCTPTHGDPPTSWALQQRVVRALHPIHPSLLLALQRRQHASFQCR